MKDKELEYRKHLIRMVAIRNSISLICFTILAIVFKNFWIVFVSVLFTSYIEDEKEE